MSDSLSQSDHAHFVVTGATGMIGGAIVRQLAADPHHHITLLCRDEGRGDRLADEINGITGHHNVRCLKTDLSRRRSVYESADQMTGKVDVLINGAAVAPPSRLETPEGIELQFATNVLGYLWLTLALSTSLQLADRGQVVNVASYWAGGLDITDLEFRRRIYDNDTAYRQSKQANRMLTVALARHFRNSAVRVNACHPGDTRSNLSRDLGFGGHESPSQCAETPLWLATQWPQDTGAYFERCRRVRCQFGEDEAAVDTLFQHCLRYGENT
jgi:NAD(P)-dependent dehydrogenase (short-subunit alcohol dehydrogenase family)